MVSILKLPRHQSSVDPPEVLFGFILFSWRSGTECGFACLHMFGGSSLTWLNMWRFPEIGVPPNHPFSMGFSITNHPFWGTLIYGNQQLNMEVSCNVSPIHRNSYGKFFLLEVQKDPVVSIGWWFIDVPINPWIVVRAIRTINIHRIQSLLSGNWTLSNVIKHII